MKPILFLTLLITLFSCNKKEEKPQGNEHILSATDSTATPAVAESDSVQLDTVIFPDINEQSYKVKIIVPGSFHSNEVSDSIPQMKWMGLFKNKDGYYITDTEVTANRQHDPVVDNDGETTGWKITTTVKDSTLLFVSGCEHIAPRKVTAIVPKKKELLPGATYEFNFSGKKYTLYALGTTTTKNGETFYNNYELYIMGKKGDIGFKTLLATAPGFDDAMMQILFIGDIDGDGTPDLILDTARHYNVTLPTLYLSKPAGNTELVVPVSIHTSVGC